MKGFRKLQLERAAKYRNPQNLDHSHLTSLDFAQIIPATSIECIPTDHFKLNVHSFSRCSPLVFPVYGKADQKFMSVFIPYHTVAYDADAFFDGESKFEGQPVQGRWITQETLRAFFTQGFIATPTGNSTHKDFIAKNASGTVQYYLFTNKGRYYYKVLRGLGYQVPQFIDQSANSLWMSKLKDIEFSAYPLLAYIKGYNDYLSSSVWYQNNMLTNMLNVLKFGKSNPTYYDPTTGHISVFVLNHFFENYFLHYENDYFTSAWRFANRPIDESNSLNHINYRDPIVGPTYVEDYKNGTYVFKPNTNTGITAISIQMLQAFDDWIRRNNYVGGRNLERLFARFGIKSDLYHKDKSEMIGNISSIPMTIGDVTATAQTDDMHLGDYAGKAIISSDGVAHHVEYHAHDYGLLCVYTWISVKPIYYQGIPRHLLNHAPTDWFNPEFDAIGPDAISFMEMCNDIADESITNPLDPTTTFGFTERYNYLKYGGQLDRITGDMLLYDDMTKWHFGRDMKDIAVSQKAAQSAEVIRFNPESQYDRIFANSSHDADHFFVTMFMECSGTRPMKNLNQSTNLPIGDLSVDRNGSNLQ